jgi:two-component system response regulator DevR
VGSSDTPVRVFLVDDHEVVRRGVAEVLEEDPVISVVGEAGSVAEALARVPAVRPDVTVVDMRLPDGDGAEVCRKLRERVPGLRCLVLTSFPDEDAVAAAVAAGASGYVLKQVRGSALGPRPRRRAADPPSGTAGWPCSPSRSARCCG